MATLYRVEVIYDGACFGCGENNQRGLKMRFLDQGGESVCEYEVPAEYQSWRGLVHGGVIALMLDEAVGWAGWHSGHPGLTGKLEVRYRQPLRIGERVRVVGRVERIRRSLVYAVSHIERLDDGARIADATATLMEAPAIVT
ncbi:MAG: PaaI family thioesterase [Candidatus Dormibacteraeota bacterium]|nr:PaaI family thioesterase [Candidatus Dormibacteraeota bacterium]